MYSLKYWSAIAVTAANPLQAQAYQKEILRFQQNGVIQEDTIVLAVPDPSSERVGSGGATLNALLTVSEYLSARAGLSYIDPEILQNAKILIIHSGGDSQRVPCYSVSGKAFSNLPVTMENGEFGTPFLLLLDQLTKISNNVSSGLFVASGDVLLFLPEMEYLWNDNGVTGLAIPSDQSYASKHGVYKIGSQSSLVENFYQKPTLKTLVDDAALLPDDQALIDSGIVYFCAETTKKILSLNVLPPLDACTYLGVDNGAIPLRVELYSDILSCMVENTQKDEYLTMPSDAKDLSSLQRARERLWDSLRSLSFHAIVAYNGKFAHLGTTKEYVDLFVNDSLFRDLFCFQRHLQMFAEDPVTSSDAVVINSLLFGSGRAEKNSIIENSELKGNWFIGERAYCSGVRSFYGLHIEKEIVLKEIELINNSSAADSRVVILFGVNDNIKSLYTHPDSTFVNRSWKHFFEISEISPDDIWSGIPENSRNLWNARLFPIQTKNEWLDSVLWLQYDKKPSTLILRKWKNSRRLSFAEILTRANPTMEFDWVRLISHKMDMHLLEITLVEKNNTFLLPILQRCAKEKRLDVLEILDSVARDAPSDVAARIFSAIADALAALADNRGGLRSGPMRNQNWKSAFDELERENISSAVENMSIERKQWLNSPERLIRAARHYEGAAQVLIRKSVETAIICTKELEPAKTGEWIHAAAPARIDLAGGWSDTPPITFEHGGVVVNMAVKLDGNKPIGVNVRKIKEPYLSFCIGNEEKILCKSLKDLSDYAQPMAPASLCKAVLIIAGLIDLTSQQPLEKQLEKIGGGLEIETWSNLPTGSGLGTSSILAATLLFALGKTIGKVYDDISLIHAVLHLEQILTTGGGWQDQIGGIIPGIKIGRSSNCLPLEVMYDQIPISENMLQSINRHCMLVYTGRTRLARNLLQDVIRRWYARYPEIVGVVDDLTRNAGEMKNYLEKGDLEGAGFSLSRYWEQKKRMAGGAEPVNVTKMIQSIQPYVYGSSLTGAGGGGFLFLILKDPNHIESVREIISRQDKEKCITFHSVEIDNEGLTAMNTKLG